MIKREEMLMISIRPDKQLGKDRTKVNATSIENVNILVEINIPSLKGRITQLDSIKV